MMTVLFFEWRTVDRVAQDELHPRAAAGLRRKRGNVVAIAAKAR